MASIYKRPNGTWHIRYFRNGKRVHESLDTTSEKLANLLKKQIEADTAKSSRHVVAKIEELREAYIAHCEVYYRKPDKQKTTQVFPYAPMISEVNGIMRFIREQTWQIKFDQIP